MTDEFENELRRLMRPVDAPEGLAERIIAALPPPVPRATVTSIVNESRVAKPPKRNYWMPGALAASLVGAVLLGTFAADKSDKQLALREEAAGLEARRELMEALRVTSQKLDLAYEAVNAPPPAPDEENRT